MKKYFIILLASWSNFAFANGMSDGTYTGTYEFKQSNSISGTRKMTIIVDKGLVTGTLEERNGAMYTSSFFTKFDANGFFDMYRNGKEIGHGYCFESKCHYATFNVSGDIPKFKRESTLRFYTDNAGIKHLTKMSSWVDTDGVKVAIFADLVKEN